MRSSVDLKKHENLKSKTNHLSSKHMQQSYLDDDRNLNDRDEGEDDMTDTNNDSRMAKYSS